MAPNGSKWFQLAPNGSNWLQMAPNGFKWIQLSPNGSKWFQMVLQEKKGSKEYQLENVLTNTLLPF